MKDISSYRFIGVDTHKDKHTAAVIDCFNRCLGIVETPNNPNPICFNQFINQVRFYTDGHPLTFGMEDTGIGCSLVCFLATSGMVVKEANPTLIERRRKRKPYPEQSDNQDVLVIAKTLLTEFDNLPDISINDLYVTIRDLSLHRNSLVKEQTRLKNRFYSFIRKQHTYMNQCLRTHSLSLTLSSGRGFPFLLI